MKQEERGGLHQEEPVRCGDLTIDFVLQRVDRGGTPIPLTPKPFQVLEVLVRKSGQIVLKEELLRIVWGEAYTERNSVEQAIRQIRSALGDDADHPRYIETVPRKGYRFLPSLQPTAPIDQEQNLPIQKSRRYVYTAAVTVALALASFFIR